MDKDQILSYLQERSRVPDPEYDTVRGWSARNCHDAIIYVPAEKKLLIAIRGQEPAKGALWPFGGGQKLGYPIEESLKGLIRKESGLDISDVMFFGKPTDHIWSVGPRGTPVHEVGNYYTAIGRGVIKPNEIHSTELFGPEEYEQIREDLPHWTKIGAEEAFKRFFGVNFDDKTKAADYYVDGKPFHIE
jgi:hypothetical protein